MQPSAVQGCDDIGAVTHPPLRIGERGDTRGVAHGEGIKLVGGCAKAFGKARVRQIELDRQPRASALQEVGLGSGIVDGCRRLNPGQHPMPGLDMEGKVIAAGSAGGQRDDVLDRSGGPAAFVLHLGGRGKAALAQAERDVAVGGGVTCGPEAPAGVAKIDERFAVDEQRVVFGRQAVQASAGCAKRADDEIEFDLLALGGAVFHLHAQEVFDVVLIGVAVGKEARGDLQRPCLPGADQDGQPLRFPAPGEFSQRFFFGRVQLAIDVDPGRDAIGAGAGRERVAWFDGRLEGFMRPRHGDKGVGVAAVPNPVRVGGAHGRQPCVFKVLDHRIVLLERHRVSSRNSVSVQRPDGATVGAAAAEATYTFQPARRSSRSWHRRRPGCSNRRRTGRTGRPPLRRCRRARFR